MIQLTKYMSYIFIAVGIIIGIKTLPAAIHQILFDFLKIQNTISMDTSNCQTLGYSITANQFFSSLFLFALLSFCVGFLLLFREQKLNLNYNYINIGILIVFFIIVFQSISLLGTIFYYSLEDSLFNKHIIFIIAFIVGCLTNILFLVLYCLIWFDNVLNNQLKLGFLFIFCLFSTQICMSMTTFIYMYGVIPTESGMTPEAFFEGFAYILNKLGIGSLCMEENNPCNDYLVRMHEVCDQAREAKAIPRIPYAGRRFIYITMDCTYYEYYDCRI